MDWPFNFKQTEMSKTNGVHVDLSSMSDLFLNIQQEMLYKKMNHFKLNIFVLYYNLLLVGSLS